MIFVKVGIVLWVVFFIGRFFVSASISTIEKITLACLGNRFPNINVKHLYCDDCKEEVEELYDFDGVQLCKECLLKKFEKIT